MLRLNRNGSLVELSHANWTIGRESSERGVVVVPGVSRTNQATINSEEPIRRTIVPVGQTIANTTNMSVTHGFGSGHCTLIRITGSSTRINKHECTADPLTITADPLTTEQVNQLLRETHEKNRMVQIGH